MAILVPCLVTLRAEFNALAPDRAKGADGWIGDTAHQRETSDHNPDETGSVPIHDADRVDEVHAVDVTTDLRVPGLTMRMVVDHIVTRHRSGADNRLRYAIYDRLIWEASNGWRSRPYTLSDPHTGHAHFSASYDSSREANTASWHLEDIPVSMTEADKALLDRKLAAMEDRIVERIAQYKVDVNPGGATPNMQPWSRVDAYGSMERGAISRKLDTVIAAEAS